VTEFGLVEMTRERVRPSHMASLSEVCPCCDGLGRIMSKENIATKIERWFHRARAGRKYKNYHLVVSPDLADVLTGNGTSRVKRMMKAYKCKINVVRDTTIDQTEYHIFDADTNTDISEQYMV